MQTNPEEDFFLKIINLDWLVVVSGHNKKFAFGEV
jgi:hypothetical protein